MAVYLKLLGFPGSAFWVTNRVFGGAWLVGSGLSDHGGPLIVSEAAGAWGARLGQGRGRDANRQTDRLTDRETNRQEGRQIERQ